MALAASPVPSSVPVDSKSLPFNKKEGDVWNSFKGGHNADDGQNLVSLVKTALDQQQQQEEEHKVQDLIANFSTGSPVTVLPPLPPYTSCSSGIGMLEIPSGAAAAWNTMSKTSVSSSALDSSTPPEFFNTFNFQEHMLGSEDCEQLLASPVVGNLPSVLEFPDPFSRFSDQMTNCASMCNEFSPVSELECLLPPAVDVQQHQHVQAVKSPESVGNNQVQNSPPLQQQQQEFCQDFFAGGSYPELNSRRSESSLLSPPSARRRLSWSEYQVVEPLGGLPSTVDPVRFNCFSSQLQGSLYDHNPFQLPLPSVQPLMDNNTLGGLNMMNAYRSSSSSGQDSLLDSLVGDAVRGSSSLKRPYSTMMSMQQQQPVPSTCSISSAAPPAPSFSTSSSTSNKYLNFGAHLPIPPVPKNLSDNCSISSPILPPILPNLSTRNCDTQQQQQQANVAAFNAMLYKTQGNSSSEMMQQLQQATQCGQGTTTTNGSSSCDSGAATARPVVPPPKLRRRHGTATDPQSIAARTRRERFSDRIRVLQSLVPNGERLDTVSMLGHTLEYVRFLQHQVWTLYNGNDDVAATADSESREKWKEFMEASQSSTVVA
ncbi:hypothetical protein R1sor_018965 [Riccia sorocarpa]|uniref:BHLH domain-containing protein n=1 Tax=Riccia sorocarpa TaxID=122646 RepID=A0ABD3IB70_9MARC